MDFFTYHMVTGSVLTAPATVAIRVVDPNNPNFEPQETGRDVKSKIFTRGNKKKRGTNSAPAPAGDIESQVDKSAISSPRRPPWRRVSTTGSPPPAGAVPRDSVVNPGLEMGEIYGSSSRKENDTTSSASAGNTGHTPFIENLMRKTSGSSKTRDTDSHV
jgi:hypothetical protein